MLHILFLILKIIGIILLSLLGVVILTLSVVLLVPVRYRVDVKNKTVQAKAHWFLHLLSAYFTYDGTKSDWQVRVAWKKFREKESEEESEIQVTAEEEDAESKSETETEGCSESDISETPGTRKTKAKSKEKKKFKCTIRKICDKMKKLWETKEKITEFISDPVHKEAFRRLKKEIIILAKRIRPRKMEGFARFGMEDPYNTGRILAGLSVLYPLYGERIQIYPDFENKVFEGELHVRGYMQVVTFAMLMWNLFFDKNIRNTYYDYKKLKP